MTMPETFEIGTNHHAYTHQQRIFRETKSSNTCHVLQATYSTIPSSCNPLLAIHILFYMFLIGHEYHVLTCDSIVRPMQTRVSKVGVQAMCERCPRSTHMLSKAGIGRPWTVRFTEHVAHLCCASVSALMRVRGYELMGRLTSEL